MHSRKCTHLLINILPTLLFILIVSLVIFKPRWVHAYDNSISSLVQSVRTPGFNQVVSIYTQLGNSIPYIIISLIVCLILILKHLKKAALFLACNIVLGNGLNHLIKQIIQRQRPEFRLISIGGYSFPSGHSVAAMVLFGSLIFITFQVVHHQLKRNLLALIYLILMLGIGLSRIYLNVHFPTDVTAGFLLGLIVLQFTTYLFYGRKIKNA